MPIQKQLIQPVGMMQDNLITSPKSNQFAHEIKNLRFNTQGDCVTASWTTEQGTLYKNIVSDNFDKGYIENQIPIGQAVINDKWILFTTNVNLPKKDNIIKLWYDNNDLRATLLYTGNLNFDAEYPIETLVYYESENIQKVYWTDGLNQPRVINICNTYTTITTSIDTQFDFVKEVSLKEKVTVSKQQGGAGQFPPCTVKYAITYYTKYGQESNIVWTSTLFYPTRGDRGLKNDELSGDIFVINVEDLDLTHKWDYIRLYSIVRTTDNSTPIVRIVESKSLANNPTDVTFYDSNTTGEIIDPTILNYVGGVKITANTFDQKNNTLFLGNISLQTKSLKSLNIAWQPQLNAGFANADYKSIKKSDRTSGFYLYNNELNDNVEVICDGVSRNTLESPKIFKSGEYYRFGIQCQDLNGIWSDVVYLGDFDNDFNPVDTDNYVQASVFKYTLQASTATILTNNGYKKARLVCCYPTNNDRSIIAQGVLCPTIFNREWQRKHTPDCASSWFYRFDDNDVDVSNEIQCGLTQSIINTLTSKGTFKDISVIEETSPDDADNKSITMTQRQVMTFHSPDVEFDNSLRTLDWSGLKLRIIGTVQYDSLASKVYIDYVKQAMDYLGNKGLGLIDDGSVITNIVPWTSLQLPTLPQYGKWNDIDVYASNLIKNNIDGNDNIVRSQQFARTYNYPIFPFQRKYLNNYMGDTKIDLALDNAKDIQANIEESSVIENKVWSTLRYSSETKYLSFDSYDEINISDCKLFDSDEVLPLILKNNIIKDGLVYYGNVNTLYPQETKYTISTPLYEYQGLLNEDKNDQDDDTTNGKHNVSKNVENSSMNNNPHGQNVIQVFKGKYPISNLFRFGGTAGVPLGVSADPVRIAYKSTPHCVVSLDSINFEQNLNSCQVFLAELYRNVLSDQRFGGTSEDALKNNIFIPCGEAVDLVKWKTVGQQSVRDDVILIGDVGDTYYMRYDNLKTYPFTRSDVNGIVDILSFMCETRINLDGRCDINRGLTDNTLIDNTNFNIINRSYTQTDNFFNYKVLDDVTILNDFPNQITWTRTKNSGEEVDTWTNITLASVADAEGTLGKITRILNNKDTLYLFQEKGIAQIGYNERTAISTENGTPLEIAKSGKFTGFNYITKNVGCQNKWSINNNKNGVFWIDNNIRQLFTFGENGPISLSTLNGFDAFFIKNIENKPTVWNPKQFTLTSGNFTTYYDDLSKDMYYINNDYCLAWNDVTKTFTSFYDYNKIPYITNISQHCLMTYLDNNTIKIYAAREDVDYSKFFDEDRPYWITLMSNGGVDEKNNYTNADKVFNVVEYKGDLFDEDKPVIINDTNMINMPLFTDISAYNGYQAYKEFNITNPTHDYPWKAERKFNMWRVIIPRATYNASGGTLVTSKDRIRNPYTYIKLVNNNPNESNKNHRAVLSNFIINFDIR